jgi:acyl carrier protein
VSREPRPATAVGEIADRVGRFVAASFLPEGADPPGPADDLFALLDSLQILRTVAWLEEAFGVPVGDADLTAENLGSVGRIAAFVAGRGSPP